MSDDELREYVEKVLSSGPGGAGRIAAPVVTLSLALRVHNMAQATINTGESAETNKLVVLALVILEMAGVHPPSTQSTEAGAAAKGQGRKKGEERSDR